MLQIVMMFLLYICVARAEDLSKPTRQEQLLKLESIDKMGLPASSAKTNDKIMQLSPMPKADDGMGPPAPALKVEEQLALMTEAYDKMDLLAPMPQANDGMGPPAPAAKASDNDEMGPP